MRVPKGVLAAKSWERWIGLRSPVTSAKPTTSEESIVLRRTSVIPTERSSKKSMRNGNGSIIRPDLSFGWTRKPKFDSKRSPALNHFHSRVSAPQYTVLCHVPCPFRHQHVRLCPTRLRRVVQRCPGGTGSGRSGRGHRPLANDLGRRVHPFRLEYLRGRRPAQRLDEGCGRILALGRCHDPGRIGCDVLDFLRKRADQYHAFHRYDFADLVDTDLCGAVDDEIGDVTALLQLRFRAHLIRNAELLEQLVDIDAARAAALRIEVGDAFGIEQCPLERLDRADVGLRRAFLHDDTYTDIRELHLAALLNLSGAHELVEDRRRRNGDVDDFALLDARLYAAGGVVRNDNFVAGLPLEIRHECEDDLFEGAGRQQVDFGSLCVGRTKTAGRKQARDSNSRSHSFSPMAAIRFPQPTSCARN